MRERRCVVTQQSGPEDGLIRFVAGPDGTIVPDISAKLPGRGAWVTARADHLAEAVKKGRLARALDGAKAGDDLADQIVSLLGAKALSLLGLARRAGGLAIGMDAARLALKAKRPAWRVEAADGAPDGRQKLDRLTAANWGEIPVAGCFSAGELGRALGRDHVVHAVLAEGPHARSFGEVMTKLSGFREIDPGRKAGESG
ncbi:RNA-binding protein [Hyphobacterium sp. HN65]|uniref:RNA-binding protein n=1 Tax=Hyphobacterium lacteum TaxID=3116575 RepID=A0ABU7LS02_9PROT|nr:RNA-binding protein [Hyphobacterium sp. HN65]MEE2526700.1 RNA-binding protein [Hyphobacterium sp. HN65]